MGNLISLKTLAKDINAKQDEIIGLHTTSLERAWECGALLIKAKEQVAHGEWASWLEENVVLSQSHCNKYMRLHRDYQTKMVAGNHFDSINEALGYLPDPEPVPEPPAAKQEYIPRATPSNPPPRGIFPPKLKNYTELDEWLDKEINEANWNGALGLPMGLRPEIYKFVMKGYRNMHHTDKGGEHKFAVLLNVVNDNMRRRYK